eukprot:4971817-Amphidinium_carterae.1
MAFSFPSLQPGTDRKRANCMQKGMLAQKSTPFKVFCCHGTNLACSKGHKRVEQHVEWWDVILKPCG